MRYLIVLCIVFISSFSRADAWDNVTLEEANAIVAELNENPFIFSYCDCCDYEGQYAATIELIKVVKTEIVTCDWNEDFYAVKAYGIVLAEVTYSAKGPLVDHLSVYEVEDVTETIFMNYTWGLNPKTKKATPFFNIVPYDYYGADSQPCKEEFDYPTPLQLKAVSKDKSYKKWWKKNIGI